LKRGTEQREDLKARLENAMGELLEASWYDYLIINDVLDEAVEALKSVIMAARFRRQAVLPKVRSLLDSETNSS